MSGENFTYSEGNREFESTLENFCSQLRAPTPPSVSSSEDTNHCRPIPLIVCNVTAPLNQCDVIH